MGNIYNQSKVMNSVFDYIQVNIVVVFFFAIKFALYSVSEENI